MRSLDGRLSAQMWGKLRGDLMSNPSVSEVTVAITDVEGQKAVFDGFMTFLEKRGAPIDGTTLLPSGLPPGWHLVDVGDPNSKGVMSIPYLEWLTKMKETAPDDTTLIDSNRGMNVVGGRAMVFSHICKMLMAGQLLEKNEFALTAGLATADGLKRARLIADNVPEDAQAFFPWVDRGTKGELRKSLDEMDGQPEVVKQLLEMAKKVDCADTSITKENIERLGEALLKRFEYAALVECLHEHFDEHKVFTSLLQMLNDPDYASMSKEDILEKLPALNEEAGYREFLLEQMDLVERSDLLSKQQVLVECYKWMLAKTKGSPNDWEQTRTFLQQRSGQAVTDLAVLGFKIKSLQPGGVHYKYLSKTQLFAIRDRSLYVHAYPYGGVKGIIAMAAQLGIDAPVCIGELDCDETMLEELLRQCDARVKSDVMEYLDSLSPLQTPRQRKVTQLTEPSGNYSSVLTANASHNDPVTSGEVKSFFINKINRLVTGHQPTPKPWARRRRGEPFSVIHLDASNYQSGDQSAGYISLLGKNRFGSIVFDNLYLLNQEGELTLSQCIPSYMTSSNGDVLCISFGCEKDDPNAQPQFARYMDVNYGVDVGEASCYQFSPAAFHENHGSLIGTRVWLSEEACREIPVTVCPDIVSGFLVLKIEGRELVLLQTYGAEFGYKFVEHRVSVESKVFENCPDFAAEVQEARESRHEEQCASAARREPSNSQLRRHLYLGALASMVILVPVLLAYVELGGGMIRRSLPSMFGGLSDDDSGLTGLPSDAALQEVPASLAPTLF